MPMKIALLPFFALICHITMAGTGDVLRCVADIQKALDRKQPGKTYDVTVQIVRPGVPGKDGFIAKDDTGHMGFGVNPAIKHECPTNAGDIVRVQGETILDRSISQITPPDISRIGADCRRIEKVGHATPEATIDISGTDFYRPELNNRLVRIKGVVYDVFRDEIDPTFVFFVLVCEGKTVYFVIRDKAMSDEISNRLVGATVLAEGITSDKDTGCRTRLGRILSARSINAIRVISSSSTDQFDAPELTRNFMPHTTRPPKIDRRRASGHVIAVWNNGERILLRTANGDLIRADLKTRPPPRYGEHIEVVGIPETDLYHINLSRTLWRTAEGPAFAEASALPISLSEIWMSPYGASYKNAWFHGYAVRITGIVRSLPTAGDGKGRAFLESDSFMIPVDCTSCPEALAGVVPGSRIEVSGTYITETDIWYPSRVFPHVRDIIIAVRKPGDVRVLARPPWWTPVRLVTLIGALLAVLLGIFAWNVALRRRAERRGRELADEQLAHVASELKVVERTRLAVELHDSLSQTLTGISMGIDSALDIAGDTSEELKRQLKYTSKAIEACRTELRNCLWDLRSQALEESDMNAAIQLALSQIVNKTALHVRFNVPRTRLSDKTAHAILRIIRELATNAIRHGHASELNVAGCIDGDTLRFSVADDGLGFDPKSAPGIAEGHFGLQGIRERLDLMDGDMAVESSPGKGAKVTVAIKIPAEKAAEKDFDYG